jgi:hypothetical protein
MAKILFSVFTEHLAFMTADWALNNNLGSWSGYGIHIRWVHTLTLLANCAHRNMNRQTMLIYYGVESEMFFRNE